MTGTANRAAVLRQAARDKNARQIVDVTTLVKCSPTNHAPLFKALNDLHTALPEGVVGYLPAGTYITPGWKPAAGLKLVGAGSHLCTIRQHVSATGANDSVLDVTGTSNVTIEGVTIDGNKSAFAVATEHKHGINAQGVTGLRLRDVVLQNCKGDGLYVGLNGAGNHSSNVNATDCSFLNNYRNNMSIADLARGTFTSCRFEGAGGTSPQCGVDLEPNDNTYVLHDITFQGCSFSDNLARGMSVTMFPGGETQKRVRIIGCTMDNNAAYGLSLFQCVDVIVVATDITNNTRDGVVVVGGNCQDITFVGGQISGNLQNGVNCTPTAGSIITNWKMIGTNVRNNGTSSPGTYYGMRFDTVTQPANSVDGVVIQNVTSTGAAQKYGLFTTVAVTNVRVSGCDFRGNATSAVSLADDSTTRELAGNNVGVVPVGAKIQVFTGTGTWTKPTGAAKVHVSIIGGGAGGGAGRRGVAASIRSGGGGGGGGAWSQAVFDASTLASSVTATIGAGGAGAASVGADNTSGAAGTSGGTSTFGSFLAARGGGGGGAGGAAGATGGTAGVGQSPGSPGGASSATGGAGTSGAATSSGGASGGGGGGGGITAADSASAAGNGSIAFTIPGTVGGSGGAVDSTAPTAGTASTITGLPGPGAGGGAGSITTAAQAGANATTYGGGGGGGGASLNGNASGAGGNGANGIIVVTTYFA